MSARWKGVKKTPEQVKKHADAIRGRKYPPRSEEYRRNISLALKGKRCWGSDVNPFTGKHHTDEAKEKNRLAHLGKKASEETRRKMSEAHKRAWQKRKGLI